MGTGWGVELLQSVILCTSWLKRHANKKLQSSLTYLVSFRIRGIEDQARSLRVCCNADALCDC